MDKSKVYMDQLKKHHFWVLCGVLFITSIVVYSMGTSAMFEETENRINQVNSLHSQHSAIQQRFQPNNQVIDVVQKDHDKLAIQAWNAWYQLYYTQRPQFKWPSGLQFYADKLNSMSESEQIKDDLRRAYHNLMRQDMERDRFKSIIKLREVMEDPNQSKALATRITEGDTPGVGPGEGEKGTKAQYKGLVAWDGFNNMFQYAWINGQHPPSEQQMKLTQEDLWVHEFLLSALAKLNQGVKENDHDRAWLKQILDFKIGREAGSVPNVNSIMAELRALAPQGTLPTSTGGEGGEFGGGENVGLPSNTGGEGEFGRTPGGEGGEPGSETAMGDTLLDGRYCDLNGKPLNATQAQATLQTDQYRLMPVRMVLRVDQRKLPDLLAALVNAQTPMRIRQVQLFHSSQKLSNLAGMENTRNTMPPPTNPGDTTSTNTNDRSFSYDMLVDIRGMVYLYQIPQLEKIPRLQEIRVDREARAEALKRGEAPMGEPRGGDLPILGISTNEMPTVNTTQNTPATTSPAADPPVADPPTADPPQAVPPAAAPVVDPAAPAANP